MVMLFDQEYAVKQFGRAQKQEGQIEGQNRLGALMTELFALGRIEDARRAASDAEYRDKLYKEFRMA